MTVDLLWTPLPAPEGRLEVIGATGWGRCDLDGSWQIVTASGTTVGPPEGEAETLLSQWRSFIAEVDGFKIADVEPAIAIVEEIYRSVPVES